MKQPRSAATAIGPGDDAAVVRSMRAFNRFYTGRIGLLDDVPATARGAARVSLTQVRLLYEIVHRTDLTATRLAAELSLDAGYLSRLLNGFERRGLIRRRAAPGDAREKRLAATASGRRFIGPIVAQTDARLGRLVAPLDPVDRARLLGAMQTIRRLLEDPAAADAAGTPAGPVPDSDPAPGGAPFRLRTHRPGDIGWVVQRHGHLYHDEYGWDASFEALVARIAARFLDRFDPACERAWIAVRNDDGDGAGAGADAGDDADRPFGGRLGCAFVVRGSATGARLRLVLVEPSARGLGIGRRLVDEAIAFATRAGYRTLTLWTNDCLHAARAIYLAAGFRLVRETPHHSFGQDLIGQNWSLRLKPT